MNNLKGTIIKNESNIYTVITEKGKYNAIPRGKFKNQDIIPVVGDKVKILIENNIATIEEIMPRNVYIKRPKLANITQIVFVQSSKNPKPDLLLLDKQLAFAEYLKVKSLIILNKIDLDKNKEFKKIKEIYEEIGYKVIETQANENIGIDKLKNELKGNISAFAGNSGVGKSTLINRLFNNNITLEGEISQKNKKGKNTTTTIQIYEIEKNAYIADTPGFSTLDISEIQSKDLDKYFIEFKKYIKNCEFIGCTHIKEENCGVKQAVENEKISKDRYNRFCKIYEELKEKEKRKW